MSGTTSSVRSNTIDHRTDVGLMVQLNYEAILATLAIIVWHFYFTMFDPDAFPIPKAMITGGITREEMQPGASARTGAVRTPRVITRGKAGDAMRLDYALSGTIRNRRRPSIRYVSKSS